MTLETKVELIKSMLDDEDANLQQLSELPYEDLVEFAAIADMIIEQVSVVLTANSMLVGDSNG
jgi:hypothetical protein